MLSHFSHVWLLATLWTVAHQAPLSMGFSKKEYWNELPGPPPGDLPYSGIKPVSPMSPAFAGGFFTTSATSAVSAICLRSHLRVRLPSLCFQSVHIKKKLKAWNKTLWGLFRSYNTQERLSYRSETILGIVDKVVKHHFTEHVGRENGCLGNWN